MDKTKISEELAAQLLHLAQKMARKYHNTAFIDEDDLVQETMLRLFNFFQPDSPKNVDSPVGLVSKVMNIGLYVQYQQRGLGSIRKIDGFLYRRISRVRQHMEAHLGRKPTVSEIADEMCIPSEICRMILDYDRFLVPVSLDAPLDNNENSSCYSDIVMDESAIQPELHIEQKDLHKQIRRVLDTLEPLESMTIKLRFGFIDDEEFSPQETAHKLEISLETEQITEIKAMRKLRHPSRSKYLEAFIH